MSKPQRSYRELFAKMAPLSHDPDPAKSEVLEFIAARMGGCSLARAVSVFNIIRNPRRRIIVHSKATGLWSGEDVLDVKAEIRALHRKIAAQSVEIADLMAAVFGAKTQRH